MATFQLKLRNRTNHALRTQTTVECVDWETVGIPFMMLIVWRDLVRSERRPWSTSSSIPRLPGSGGGCGPLCFRVSACKGLEEYSRTVNEVFRSLRGWPSPGTSSGAFAMVTGGGVKCWLGSAIPPAVVEEPFERFSGTRLYWELIDIHTVSGATNIIWPARI